MNNLFFILVLLSFPVMIYFGIRVVISYFKKNKLHTKKMLKLLGVSFCVMVVSLIAFTVTIDPVEAEKTKISIAEKEEAKKLAVLAQEKAEEEAKKLAEKEAEDAEKLEVEEKAEIEKKLAEEKIAVEAKEKEEKAAAELKAKQDAKAKEEAEAKAKEEEKAIALEKLKAQSLGYDLDEFTIRFNKAAKEFESSFRINNPAVTTGDIQDVSTIMLNDNIAMNVTINKEDKSVRDVLMIGQGDGTTVSGLNIIVTIGTIIAATNPELTPDERGDVLQKLGLMDGTGLSEEQISTVKNGVKYTISSSDLLGIMFSTSNQNDN